MMALAMCFLADVRGFRRGGMPGTGTARSASPPRRSSRLLGRNSRPSAHGTGDAPGSAVNVAPCQ